MVNLAIKSLWLFATFKVFEFILANSLTSFISVDTTAFPEAKYSFSFAGYIPSVNLFFL